MNKFEKWLLRRLIRKAVCRRYLPQVMKQIWADCRYRFYEDNAPTRYSYVEEQIYREYRKEIEDVS